MKESKLEPMFDNSHNDSEKIRKLESEVKKLRSLINLIISKMEESK